MIYQQIKDKRKLESDQIPKRNIERKHIRNTILLSNREELLELMPKNGIVAELGVDQGDFSLKILEICVPKKLHLIDFWGTERYNQTKRQNVEFKFGKEIDSGHVEINLGLSTQIVNQFGDNYFDWIYIDTDHSYKVTKEELELYRMKVKENGIIAGHDFIVGNWNGMVRYGVIEAVYEFCMKYNWEILYLSVETEIPPSFAIRKMNL